MHEDASTQSAETTKHATSVIRAFLDRAQASVPNEANELERQFATLIVERDRALANYDKLTVERDKAVFERDKAVAQREELQRKYDVLKEQVELLRRRIFMAKAERIDVTQLELEFGETKKKLDALGVIDETESDMSAGVPPEPPPAQKKPKGRRDLRNMQVLREDRIELLDDEVEKLVAEGKAERITFEETHRLGYQRGGPIRLVVARAKYRVVGNNEAVIHTAERPKELLRRSLLAPSMLAHLMIAKYSMGMPFFRLEESLSRQGIDLDRGSMCRYAEDLGASLGPIVDACAKEALSTAFCLSTDATGVSIQPAPLANKSRQACKKGHFFVVLADRDHVFFEYQPRHTSAAVCDMFRGYSGYIQADAHAIYDALYRGDAVTDGAPAPKEVACWAHVRRKFWESAVQKHKVAREGLLRIRAIFERDAKTAKLPPDKRKVFRQQIVRPLVDDFFVWAENQFDAIEDERGSVAKALGYAIRQRDALCRFLDDPRLEMTNNRSERALRSPIATGRKAWLFFGSDDHATAAANLFSLIASCRLHRIEPEAYLRDVIRVMPYWPRDRYLELAPRYWADTRARLDLNALACEVGPIAVPCADAPEEKLLPN